MRSGASHPGPHHSCVPVPALSPRRRRHERYSQHLPRGALHMLKLGYRLAIVRSRISNRCGTNSSALPQEQGGGGGRNARATSRAVARFWKFPLGDSLSRITAAACSPQSSGRARNHHVSLEHNLFHFVASRNTKENWRCAETVEEQTSLWKTEENLELLSACAMRV